MQFTLSISGAFALAINVSFKGLYVLNTNISYQIIEHRRLQRIIFRRWCHGTTKVEIIIRNHLFVFITISVTIIIQLLKMYKDKEVQP